LIGDVLDYARIEAGKLAPKKKNISVGEILKDVTNIVRFQADQKHIDVSYIESTEVLAVSVDRKHFRQVLINLLTNAVKYTPDGGKIEVWAERAPSQLIRINVKDSGVGIDPSQRDKVFAPFERLNHSYSRQQAGVGLGLSLAKRLAEINGGSLDFESKLGTGSRFWVLLKSAEVDALDKGDFC
jgi:signal transduction histidine kinase